MIESNALNGNITSMFVWLEEDFCITGQCLQRFYFKQGYSYLSKLERGLSSPTIGTLLRLAKALGRSTEQLLGESEQGDDIVLVKAKDRIVSRLQDQKSGRVMCMRLLRLTVLRKPWPPSL